ncbi:MAG TPA: ATP-binding protein [Vicinamibacterales bacterium]|jgi:heavy metal sensor kinase
MTRSPEAQPAATGRRRWRGSVRARLALAHGIALLVVVSIYGAASWLQLRDDLHEQIERERVAETAAGRSESLRLASSEEAARHELREFSTALLVSLPLAFGVAVAAGYWLARRALAPVAAMTARARQITADRLDDRLPIENPQDEFGQLALVFNDALARLQRSFETLRRFTADASHELRTPLTAIRSVGEVGLRERRGEAEYREMVGSILEEADRLTKLVDSLLTLSRADAGRVGLSTAPLDLAETAREAVDDLGVLAEEKRQTIELVSEGPVPVRADRTTIRQAVINLLDNAIKFSPDDSRIRVVVRQDASRAVLEVADDGPGIAAEHLPHLFERFYRVDGARSAAAGGAGLGLSIAQWSIEANGGQLEAESSLGHGSVFRIVLALDKSLPR